jgi:hypothetical protein
MNGSGHLNESQIITQNGRKYVNQIFVNFSEFLANFYFNFELSIQHSIQDTILSLFDLVLNEISVFLNCGFKPCFPHVGG